MSYASSGGGDNDFLIFKSGGNLYAPYPIRVRVLTLFYNAGSWINLVFTRNVTDGKFYFDGVHTHSLNSGSGSHFWRNSVDWSRARQCWWWL